MSANPGDIYYTVHSATGVKLTKTHSRTDAERIWSKGADRRELLVWRVGNNGEAQIIDQEIRTSEVAST